MERGAGSYREKIHLRILQLIRILEKRFAFESHGFRGVGVFSACIHWKEKIDLSKELSNILVEWIGSLTFLASFAQKSWLTFANKVGKKGLTDTAVHARRGHAVTRMSA